MPTELRCEKCGSQLATFGGQALCPLCLMQEAVHLGDERDTQSTPLLDHRTRTSTGSERSGDCIDRYRLLQPIGAGGMGIVYLAEQVGPVARRVALKVIKLGMDTKAVITRFEAERQILELMDHPHIARVLDAGITEAGRPYFVMELVRGIKITDYCIQNHLPLRERLDLFVKVCLAIQHAHQKGIIHRDLKPSNILVALQDGMPGPKVIDFGIAKAISERRAVDTTPLTAFAQFLGTPAYMSPEQTSANGLDIDTRSDVYSLGILLYELLTGRTPFDADALRTAGVEAICRTIREQEPARPSTRLAKELASLSRVGLKSAIDDASALRREELKELIPRVRGDLDWIVMKALEKDRDRRYATANGLAMDIQRYLGNELVVARPPSTTYRLQKMVRRNKLAVAAVSAVAMALIAGLIASTWFYLRAKADLHRALAAEQSAQTVAQFLETMLKSLDPELALGRNTPILHELLNQTAERVATDLASQPEIQAKLGGIIGNGFYQLEDFARAEEMYRMAWRLRTTFYGETNRWAAASLNDLGNAITMQDRQPEGEGLLRQALAMRETIFGHEHVEVAKSLTSLADNLTDQDKLTDAESLQREALAMQRKFLGPEHPDIALSLKNLARIHRIAHQWQEAEAVYREMVVLARGKVSLDLSGTLLKLSDVLRDQGKLGEAEIFCREGLTINRRLLGNTHPTTVFAINELKLLLQRQQKVTEWEAVLREYLDSLQQRMQADDTSIINTLTDLSTILVGQERFAEAEAITRECLSLRERKMPDDWQTFSFRSALGRILAAENKYEEAELLLRSGYQGMKERETKIPAFAQSYYKNFIKWLVQFYDATGRSDQAAEWEKKLAEFGQKNSPTNAVSGAQ